VRGREDVRERRAPAAGDRLDGPVAVPVRVPDRHGDHLVREGPGRAERVLGSGRAADQRAARRRLVDPLHVTVRAPGRLNLTGEHPDDSGGLALPAAIQLGLTVTGESVPDEIVLVSTGYGTAELFPADGAGPPVQGWARYAQAVARELDALGRP